MSSGIWNWMEHSCVVLTLVSKVSLTVWRCHWIVRSVLFLNWEEMRLEGTGSKSVPLGASL